jgi:streptogramin lyase
MVVALLASAGAATGLTPTITEFSAGLNPGGDPNFGMAPGSDGNVWFTDRGPTEAIGRITPSGVITEFSTGLNAGSSPQGLAAGPDGNLWFTDTGTTKAIGRITPSGAITEFSTGLNAGSSPFSITAGPDGNLWFTDPGTTRAIGRITPSGVITEFSSGLNAGAAPSGIAPGSDGNVWFGDQGTTPAMGRITPSGAINEFSAGMNANASPYGVAAGSDGNVWFIGDGPCPNSPIGRITMAGAINAFSSGLIPGSCGYFIAPGPDGALWFSDEAGPPSDAVGRITTAGQIEEFTSGLNAGALLYGISAGPDGNIWFGDTGTTHAIGRITTPPATTTGGATVLGAGAANIAGTANGHSQSMSDRFEYGTTSAYGGFTTSVDAGSGSTDIAMSAKLTGLEPNTTYHYRALATNPTGTSVGADATFATLPLPIVFSSRVDPKTWRRGSKLPEISRRRRAPVGTKIKFSLSRAASVQLAFNSKKPGRKIKGKCRRKTRSNRKARRCTRLVFAGQLSFSGHAGNNSVRFQGRLSRSKRLKPGRYQLRVTATDATAPTPSSRTASFTIVKRRR